MMATITLPTKKCVAETGWPEQSTTLLYGPSKVGKTSFLSGMPEVLILNTEPRGTRYIEGAYVVDITSREELLDVYKKLKAGYDSAKKPPYRTIAIDTIDAPVDWICKQVMKELGVDMMGQTKNGYDWITARERTLSVVRMFANLPVNLVITAHSKPVELEGGKLGATLNLFNSLSYALQAEVENIMLCVPGNPRKLMFSSQAGTDMGSHHPVLNKVGSCDLNYNALRALIKDKGD